VSKRSCLYIYRERERERTRSAIVEPLTQFNSKNVRAQDGRNPRMYRVRSEFLI